MNTSEILEQLRAYESRNVTFIEPDGSWPMVWERAEGVHVWDADGKKYLDLTAAFGVAAAGHANQQVVKAGQSQMARLLHAMGDVHPHALKAQLARELSRLTFERWRDLKFEFGFDREPSATTAGKTIFGNSGFEAVEAALKTAYLATGRSDIIAFRGGYHGLGYGALAATHRDHFRSPFRPQLCEFAHFAPFPRQESDIELTEKVLERLFKYRNIGAILVEPIQGRGGIHIPPPEFLPLLRFLCEENEALLIFDEIYTGFARTGKWFACEHSEIVPDLLCLGKALTGGFPLSACVGRADLMDTAWPEATGEAIHTSTFLGHPVGCAMALAQMAEIEELKLAPRSADLGAVLLQLLSTLNPQPSTLALTARGVGLMCGLELHHADGSPATVLALKAIKAMLQRGFILLPAGEHTNVISFTPPLIIAEQELRAAVGALQEVLAGLPGP